MFKCLKCDEIVTDGSRICRKCGSILDEVPDPVEESFIVAESVAADEDVDMDEAPPDLQGPSSAPEKHWQCSKCSAQVPMNFLICWKCQHPRDEQEVDATAEPATDPVPSTEVEPIVEAVVAQAILICPKCASDDLVPNARIHVIAEGRLQVTLEPDENPEDDPGLLSANVCQRCGYVELRASNFSSNL